MPDMARAPHYRVPVMETRRYNRGKGADGSRRDKRDRRHWLRPVPDTSQIYFCIWSRRCTVSHRGALRLNSPHYAYASLALFCPSQ